MRLAPSGPIKTFKSTVNVMENNQVVQTRVIEVNRPFSYKGYTFYQSGYNPMDLAWTSFQVVSDPGVPVVYAGFALMIAGLFLVFYLNAWLAAGRGQAAAPAAAAGLTRHPPAVPSAAPPMPLETETVASTE
jgi:cytochrome c biogenesis protein ResB